MQLVIADTGPINYLILIEHAGILPTLFERVILPSVVRDELMAAPPLVRHWIASPPPWVEVRSSTSVHHDLSLENLDAGERDAIALALAIHADLILMDGLLNLGDAFDRLKRTNFHYSQDIMDQLLKEVTGGA